jgi:hypothetical protein
MAPNPDVPKMQSNEEMKSTTEAVESQPAKAEDNNMNEHQQTEGVQEQQEINSVRMFLQLIRKKYIHLLIT